MTNSHSPTLNPINTNQATEVIETLMNLAQQGEIDPWDVQVIDVIDRFLNELGINEYGDNIYEQATLPRSGQAFLWASNSEKFSPLHHQYPDNTAEVEGKKYLERLLFSLRKENGTQWYVSGFSLYVSVPSVF